MQVLEDRQVKDVSRMLYVVAPVLNLSDVRDLHHQHFVVMTKSRFTLEIHPDIANAVDWQVSRDSSVFLGNMYSAFSYILRESKLTQGESERASYYNVDVEATAKDLTLAEALRWNVQPFRHP